MRAKHRTLTLILTALAAFALVAGACGDDDGGDSSAGDETTTTEAALSGEEFVARVDELCEAEDEASDQLNEDLSDALEDVDVALQEGDDDAAAEGADEAAGIFQQGIDDNERFLAEVEALGVPEEHRETVDAIAELLEEQNAIIEQARAALADRDYDAFIEIGNDLNAEAEEIDERSQELADELGTEHCGPDDEPDADEPDADEADG